MSAISVPSILCYFAMQDLRYNLNQHQVDHLTSGELVRLKLLTSF